MGSVFFKYAFAQWGEGEYNVLDSLALISYRQSYGVHIFIFRFLIHNISRDSFLNHLSHFDT